MAKRCCVGWTGSNGRAASGGLSPTEDGASTGSTTISEEVVSVPTETKLGGGCQSSKAVNGVRGVDAGVASISLRPFPFALMEGGAGGGCIGNDTFPEACAPLELEAETFASGVPRPDVSLPSLAAA